MIITSAEQMRNFTGSYYANNDFSKIENIVKGVEQDLCRILGLSDFDNLGEEAMLAAQQAVAFMAAMRFYRLNDVSHENEGRKVKIDKDNEARPFEWQLARDDRAHLEEYYRALDRLVALLQADNNFKETRIYKRAQQLLVKDADTLSYLTGVDPSPWLYVRMVPFLDESQRFVEKAYGAVLLDITDDNVLHAAQMAVALGAVALMGRRCSLQTMPYGLMQLSISDGGGNSAAQPSLEQLNAYLKQLTNDQRYWVNEMKILRDKAAGKEPVSHLQMPENDKHHKYMRV